MLYDLKYRILLNRLKKQAESTDFHLYPFLIRHLDEVCRFIAAHDSLISVELWEELDKLGNLPGIEGYEKCTKRKIVEIHSELENLGKCFHQALEFQQSLRQGLRSQLRSLSSS